MSSYSGRRPILDDDDRARSCRVELHKRPVFTDLGFHWALYFQWEDGYDMHYEATDVHMFLTPNWGRGKPEQSFFTSVTHLATKVLSPKRVHRCARENRYNGAFYVLTKMNCQVWAWRLASDLGITTIPLPTNITRHIPAGEVLEGVADGLYFGFSALFGSSKKSLKDK
ncbi:uncharacterized protein [Macrobrachium rosenbergii]|uniref:uncharacterized protein isoform X2 n=1 Tax=Macrobrachium rosenbergii TaxID=79674 RepID=UPI0034D3ABF6